MQQQLNTYLRSLVHLAFPQYCEGCGSDVLQHHEILCSQCLLQLPETRFNSITNNPIEQIFYGRLNIHAATSVYYFTKDSLIQHLMVELKYKDNKKTGRFLGQQLGAVLAASPHFESVDALIPLPLNSKKEQTRGYNQATVICEGIQTKWHKPIISDAVTRTLFTQSQTKQDRFHRWQNMDGVFAITNQEKLSGKHVLLVDDVVTTGATLEACGTMLQTVPNITLSIATVAYTI